MTPTIARQDTTALSERSRPIPSQKDLKVVTRAPLVTTVLKEHLCLFLVNQVLTADQEETVLPLIVLHVPQALTVSITVRLLI